MTAKSSPPLQHSPPPPSPPAIAEASVVSDLPPLPLPDEPVDVDDEFPARYRRSASTKGDKDEFDSKKKTKEWVRDDLRTFDKFGLKKCCKKVYCDRDYSTCVRISGYNNYHKKEMTVVGCSKDHVEQCYKKGIAQKRGDTYGKHLGGPIGDVWNAKGHEDKLTACQCETVREDKRKDVHDPCN